MAKQFSDRLTKIMSQHAATQEDTDMAKSTEDRLSDLEKRVKELEDSKAKERGR